MHKYCPPVVCKPRVSPVRTQVRDFVYPSIVPYIHPTQTINRHHFIVNRQHSFPHTVRNVATYRSFDTVVPPTAVGPAGFGRRRFF